MIVGDIARVPVLAAFLAAAVIATAGAGDLDGARESENPTRLPELRADEVEQFLRELKLAFAADGCAAIADLIAYPYLLPGSPDLGRVTTGDREPEGPKLATPDEFIKQCRTIVTPEVREAVRRQQASNLFSNWRGVMIGRGEVWFAEICAAEECASRQLRIIRVNGGR